VKYFRKAWHWLTSMRTALALLFLLALAAIPGSLLPQRDLNEQNVQDFIESNGNVAKIYDKLQLFDVFSSVWFQASLRPSRYFPGWLHPAALLGSL